MRCQDHRRQTHESLVAIAKDPEALYRIAARNCSMAKRPGSIDHEDHLHDAIVLALELIRNTSPEFPFPLNLEPEDWLVRSIRRQFHPRSFYHKEYAWARRRLGGDLREPPEGSPVAGSPVVGITEDESALEELCARLPETCVPAVRLLYQGATYAQIDAILGKRRGWCWWRLKAARSALKRHGVEILGPLAEEPK